MGAARSATMDGLANQSVSSRPSVSQTLKWAGLVVKRPIQRFRGGRADEKSRRKPMNEK